MNKSCVRSASPVFRNDRGTNRAETRAARASAPVRARPSSVVAVAISILPRQARSCACGPSRVRSYAAIYVANRT